MQEAVRYIYRREFFGPTGRAETKGRGSPTRPMHPYLSPVPRGIGVPLDRLPVRGVNAAARVHREGQRVYEGAPVPCGPAGQKPQGVRWKVKQYTPASAG